MIITRRDVLVATASALMLPTTLTRGGSQHDNTQPSFDLRWLPPPQNQPIKVQVGSGFFTSPLYRPDQDIVLIMPSSIREAGADIQINGGRHVRIFGGHTQGRLLWRNGTGSIFVEGLIIDLTEVPNRDAIVVSGASGWAPDVFLQNIFVTGVQGTFAGTHADVFQPYGPIGNLRVNSFTGDTNYQGFFIRPEHSVTSATFSRVNLKFNSLGKPEGNTYLFWCRNLSASEPAKGDPYFPVEYGLEVYAEANSRAPFYAAAFPSPGSRLNGRDGKNIAGINQTDGSILWPNESGISGMVKLGRPPSGDFVTKKEVGLNYR